VVISSCGHAGIVNTVQQAIEVSGVNKVHACWRIPPVRRPDDTSPHGQRNQDTQPRLVIPLHCSGPGFVEAMRSMLGDRLVTSTTGTEFQFGRLMPYRRIVCVCWRWGAPATHRAKLRAVAARRDS